VAAAAPEYTLEHHQIATPDGVKLAGTLLRRPGAAHTILYFGGNEYRSGVFGAQTLKVLAPLGADLMIVDHRGYGASEGLPTAKTIETDGVAAYDHLAGLPGMASRPIVVHGQSLGSFIAGYVAANRPTAGVVLESSMTSADDWAASQVPWIARPFVSVRLDETLRGRGNLARMAAIDEPLLILAGEQDRSTPPRFSEALHRASPLGPGMKRLVIVPGAGHNNVLTHREAMAAYRTFLDRLGTAPLR
jgi:pimeloyl-ACP methyl ester carboxylesterase